MKMLCVLFQLVDIPFQCLNGFLQLALPVADPIDKGYLLFILDLVELFYAAASWYAALLYRCRLP